MMPRFQSRLFNWIDQSLPAKLGRRTRQMLDRQFNQISSVKELPRLLAYQAAKAALYPVYLIASNAKRTFPALDRNKTDSREKLRSQPDSGGLLPEADAIAASFETVTEQAPPFENPVEIPLLLRPLVKFLSWIDRTKIKIDRNIAEIVKRQPDNLAKATNSETSAINSELESRLLANRIFAEIWQQQVGQRQGNPDSLKENNGLAENVALGKNTRLEQLRRLIEAAIAYFFGNQSEVQVNSFTSEEELPGDSSLNSSLSNEDINQEITDSPQLRRKKIKAASSKKNPLQKNSTQSATAKTASGVIKEDALKENAPLIQNSNLDRLRELIAAAIDYFIGKRSLGSNFDSDQTSDIQGSKSEFIAGKSADKIQSSPQISTNRDQDLSSESTDESINALKGDDQIERLRKLIEEAIAYFFGKQRSQPILDETSDITTSEEAWLTMEDVFGDDNGPWPLPLEYESHAFTKSPDMGVLNSSGELQSFETTTTQISQDRLEGSLIFEEELLLYQQQNPDPDSDRPLRAWIEANATILGYTYNPVMTVILWIDAIVLKLENMLISFWRGVVNFPKRLLHFIRYGKRRQK